ILFANLGYLHYFSRHFGNIVSEPAGSLPTPGKVELGDVFQYGLGMAFALNDRMSLSLSYAQSVAQKASVKADGGNWSSVVGSDANASTLNLGLTYGLSDHLTMVTNLGVGLTKDAPDVMLSMKFPYNF
ncbi:MAG: autotransporter outer membrane beta-barrel domain-containing protein, partial [Gammaproteobacteria bacterium]|nr:autotransporter outer membrane beta-barrel domain-containing protein [Gammaproteobacteria bacterium]